MFGWGSSSLPHIKANASPYLVDLWQMTTLLSEVFFVIIDCHFIVMSTLCIGSLLDFGWLFAFVFFLWVVSLICLVLLMDGFPSLIFVYRVFLLMSVRRAQQVQQPVNWEVMSWDVVNYFVCDFCCVQCEWRDSHLFCTFDGWVPILDFYLQGFSSNVR